MYLLNLFALFDDDVEVRLFYQFLVEVFAGIQMTACDVVVVEFFKQPSVGLQFVGVVSYIEDAISNSFCRVRSRIDGHRLVCFSKVSACRR